MSSVSDDRQPFSQIVREYGVQQGEYALARADEWRAWSEQLDELLREIPLQCMPWIYAEDGDRTRVPMGADHVDRTKLRKRLYRVVADADAYATALTRAAVLAENQSTELADQLAADECTGCGQLPYQCNWNMPGAEEPCCADCSHAETGVDGEPRG